jgi:two-component system sensor histidine kinase YesM
LKKIFMNLSLKFKITIINFIIVVIAVSFLGIFFYNLYVKNVIGEVGNYQAQNTDFIKNDIGLIEDNITSLSTNLIINQDFQYMLGLSPSQIANISKSSSDLNTSINLELNALVSNDYISYISVYTSNGYNYYYSKNGSCTGNPYSSISSLTNVKKAIQLTGEPYWTSLSNNGEGILINNTDSKLTMFKGIININNLKVQGLLIVCIDWDTVWSYVPKSENYIYVIADGNGNIVSSASDYSQIKDFGINLNNSIPGYSTIPNKSVVKINGNSYLFTRSSIPKENFYIISLLPIGMALQDVRSIIPVMILVVFVCLAFSLIISIFTSSLVTKPVKKLIEAIHHAKKGDLMKKVNFYYNDEIGVLGNEYNNMLDELNLLFNRVLQMEIRNKESEIKAMQEQINPHFLYNTLDSIYLKALKSNDFDTADMIYSLSHIFRLTLNCGNEFFSVKDEKELMENYLSLQKIRFKDKLDYSIMFDERMLDVNIPKLTLQPFVENSITHGIENSILPIKIEINGFYEQDMLTFTIKDNGSGIDPEILNEILSEKKKVNEGNSHGFAINNVKERLRLYYGENQKFEISSQTGVGTVVSIKISEIALQK